MSLSETERNQLETEGFLVLEDFIDRDRVEELRSKIAELFREQGDNAGGEFKQEPQTDRLANLVNCGEVFERAVSEPRLLECVRAVLGPEFKLSSLNARSARARSDWVQPLHCDTGALPDERGFTVCNIVWMLDDFTLENGPPRYVPRTHRSGRLPEQVLDDPMAEHPDQRLITGRAGTVVVMNAHLWHGGTANRTDRPRLALHSFYCRRDVPQQQYQKRLLSAEVRQRMGPEMRRLLALDDPLNDELSSLQSGRSGFMK